MRRSLALALLLSACLAVPSSGDEDTDSDAPTTSTSTSTSTSSAGTDVTSTTDSAGTVASTETTAGASSGADASTTTGGSSGGTGPENGAFSAYNDLAWGPTQLDVDITTLTSPNGTSGLDSAGNLVDYATGRTTSVVLSIAGGNYDIPGQEEHGAEPAQNTDAYEIFAGIVSGVGAVSYVDEPDAPLELTFSNLDAELSYELVFYAHRGDYAWDRASVVTLEGAGAFVNTSSVGLDDDGSPLFSGPSDASVRLPADNTEGFVARFVDIDAGVDGEIQLTVAWDGSVGSEFLGKYASAVMLAASPWD